MTRWVTDASPLIFLAKLGHLDLLRDAADEVYLPSKVLAEIRSQHDRSTAAIDNALQLWLHVEDPSPSAGTSGSGEEQAITLAVRIGAERIVLDDLVARKQARRAGLQVIGTFGILLAARLRGDLASLEAEIEKLRDLGFRASDELVAAVLREAGEAGG